VAELERGAVESVVFTAPPALSWTLPLYELALLAATRLAERHLADVRLTVVTPEPHALEVFGPAAAKHVRELCANRGIAMKTGLRAVSLEAGRLELEPDGHIPADRVVALPELHGARIPGLPCDHAGFIPVDEHGAVRGRPGVYAAGDGIAYPIKQGGLAAQQADAAAEAIAASFGAAVEPHPFRARLRGQLLTGLAPTYLEADVMPRSQAQADAEPRESSLAVNPLWWPPSKIAGRYLAPYLSGRASVAVVDQLVDRAPLDPSVAAEAVVNHEEARRLALAFAESDAAYADYRSALKWLETVEQLDGLLSPAHAAKRAEWRRRAN